MTPSTLLHPLKLDVGVDEKTVRLIFEDYYKTKDADYKPTASRVLGIDELYLGRVYRAIFTNITESTVIDLLPNRNKPTNAVAGIRRPVAGNQPAIPNTPFFALCLPNTVDTRFRIR